MKIGKPKRVHHVEPVRDPVPPERRPVERPVRELAKQQGAGRAK
jgi:hypothetical protein